MLAARYKGDSTVIGFDFTTSRESACWGCGEPAFTGVWPLSGAGNSILETDPNLLIVVEGVELHNNQTYWWGGNLKGVADAPVLLRVANRIIYSAHDYPSSIYPQPWFGPGLPGQSTYCLGQWTWGYIARTGTSSHVDGRIRVEAPA